MVEDGCEADMDLPALDGNQPIARFEFDSFCLVRAAGHDDGAWGASSEAQGGGQEREMRVVRIQCAKEWSKLKIDALMTVAQLISAVIAKRKMRVGPEYVPAP